MPTRKYVQETAKLAKKSSDGSYRVVLITEGEGSSGRYSGELIDRSGHVYEGVPSFLNHPIDPNKPHLRPVESIAGRFSNVEAEDGPLGRQLAADFKPRSEYAAFIEEFADILGLSIFCAADGEVMDDGRLDVHEFDAEDPYRSVDIVVAAGRGGRFKRAEESLRAIESSLGRPEGAKPAVDPSAEEKEGEHMEEVLKAIEALAKNLEPVVAFVNESAVKAAKEAQAQVDDKALTDARAEGAKAAAEAFKAIDDAELPETIAEGLKAKVLEGEDVTKEIESAKAVIAAVAEAADEERDEIVFESAERKQKKEWSY